MSDRETLHRDDIIYRERLMNTHNTTFEETQEPGYTLLPLLTQQMVDEFRRTVDGLTRAGAVTQTYKQLIDELIPKTRPDPSMVDDPDLCGVILARLDEIFPEAQICADGFIGPDDASYDAQAADIRRLPSVALVKAWNAVCRSHDIARIRALHVRVIDELMAVFALRQMAGLVRSMPGYPIDR